MKKIAIFWFRRDLRLEDNAGLFYALKENPQVLPLFIFDKDILDKLEDKKDKRVAFIHQAIEQIYKTLNEQEKTILVKYGKPIEIFKDLSQQFPISVVYTNHDYEPYARKRDKEIQDFLASQNINFKTYKDQCIFEKSEVLSNQEKPYTVFTPYSKKWKSKLNDFYLKPYPCDKYFQSLINKNESILETHNLDLVSLKQMGFEASNQPFPNKKIREEIVKNYSEQRDFPAIEGTSRLSVHLRFGTISIRKVAQIARELNEKWLNELIWRDFYMMILWNFPRVASESFKKDYDKIVWRNNEEEFKRWCEGKTGYPIVDAGMRELNKTGFMHNRVRMITASFLIKHLLIDWRWGETYFAQKLLDFDLSANNGGWQWAASSGCDAVPYFRIFNPKLQTQKFDPELKYIKKWIPELNSLDYPQAIVEHKFARDRVLETYKKAVGKDKK